MKIPITVKGVMDEKMVLSEQKLKKEKKDESQLDRFWDITSRWYFFPLLFILLGIFFVLITGGKPIAIIGVFMLLPFLPLGLLTIVGVEIGKSADMVAVVFWGFVLYSMVKIIRDRIKKNIIHKKLIVILLLLIILAFAGCVGGANSGAYWP